MSIPRHQATRAPAEGRGSGGASSDAEAKRGNRAQLIGAAAVALVLIGTTAFVLLREAAPPPSEPPAAAQPAPQAPPALPPSQPAPSVPAPAPAVAATPPVAPPPAPAEAQPATPPPVVAPPATEPTEAEAKPASKRHAKAREQAEAKQPAASGVYTLQLDSFLVPENATALIARMNAHGGSAYDKPEPDGNGKTWHKVRVGAYDSEAEAEAAAEDLKHNEGINALIVRTTAEDAK